MLAADRFSRQILFAPIGASGQERIAESRVLIVGLGAVGASVAELLCRAGVGTLCLIDRDVVEESNLHRQTLFTLAHAREATPKAVAAREGLAALGGGSTVLSSVMDVTPATVPVLTSLLSQGTGPVILCDATDTFGMRYLLSDFAVREGLSLAYAGAIGSMGAAGLFVAPRTPCLRCLFPEPPVPGSIETCDTLGVIAPAAHAAASLVVAMILRFLVEPESRSELVNLDVWSRGMSRITLGAERRDPACEACVRRLFPALRPRPAAAVLLCGRDSYQVNPQTASTVDLAGLGARLRKLGAVTVTPYLVKADLSTGRLVVFPDGRALVSGVRSETEARRLVAEAVGA